MSTTACGNAASQDASCVAPTIAIAERTATPGGTIHVTGLHFVAECHDVVQAGQTPAPNKALSSVSLIWSDPGHPSSQIAVLHPRADGSVTAAVEIPTTAAEGQAQLFVKDFTTPVTLVVSG